jgi:hypothetical protein
VLPSATKRERPRFPETVSNLPFRALCGDVYSHTVGRRGVLARKTTGYQSNQRQCTPWGSVDEYHFRAVQGGAQSGLRLQATTPEAHFKRFYRNCPSEPRPSHSRRTAVTIEP